MSHEVGGRLTVGGQIIGSQGLVTEVGGLVVVSGSAGQPTMGFVVSPVGGFQVSGAVAASKQTGKRLVITAPPQTEKWAILNRAAAGMLSRLEDTTPEPDPAGGVIRVPFDADGDEGGVADFGRSAARALARLSAISPRPDPAGGTIRHLSDTRGYREGALAARLRRARQNLARLG
jgi:hypothetical protein